MSDLLGSPLAWDDGLRAAAAPERWVQKHPDSALARLALASHHIATGWNARGSGFAGQVTEEGWRAFAKYLGKAEAVLKETEVTEAARSTCCTTPSTWWSWRSRGGPSS